MQNDRMVSPGDALRAYVGSVSLCRQTEQDLRVLPLEAVMPPPTLTLEDLRCLTLNTTFAVQQQLRLLLHSR